jgi:hypothetical protein
MKKLLVHLESDSACGVWDDFIAYAEDELDNNLFAAIDDQYVEMYHKYGHYIDYESNEESEQMDEFISNMVSDITEWDDEIEEEYGDNLPIIYDARNNEDSSN